MKQLKSAVILILLFVCHITYAQDNKLRIASMSLCTDELLLLLAEPEQIASLSYLSADPNYSWLAHLTNDIPLNTGQAEEIIPLEPSIILSSKYSASSATTLLQRLGHEVTILDFPVDRDDIYQQIRFIAQLVGAEAKGEVLISEMEQEIETALLTIKPLIINQTAMFYTSNGFSFGNNTLRHAMLEDFGFNNLVAAAGMEQANRVSLEWLLAAEPDFLFTEMPGRYSSRLAHQMLEHPGLHKMLAPQYIIALPDQLFECGGPLFARAYTQVAEQISKNL